MHHPLVTRTNTLLDYSTANFRLRPSNQLSGFQKFRYFWENSNFTGQRISSIGNVPIEILSGKRHITWVLAALLFTTEFQIEPLTPNAISYDTKPATY